MYDDFVRAVTGGEVRERRVIADAFTSDVGEYAGRVVALLRVQRTDFDPVYERSSVVRKLGDLFVNAAFVTFSCGLSESLASESLDEIEARGVLIWLGGCVDSYGALEESSLLLVSAVTELVHLLLSSAGEAEDGLLVRLATFRVLTLVGAVCGALRVSLRDVAEGALKRCGTSVL
jgi:hypothetical protein